MLYSNCSEATCRLKVTDKDTKEIDRLEKELKRVILKSQYPEDKFNNLTRDEIEDKFNDIDGAYINRSNIFGIDMITISGDFPYNNGEVISTFATKYNLEEDWEEN